MPDTTLIHGPYRMPPRCRPGGVLFCLHRGDVQVKGITAAPIAWPYSQGQRWRPLPILAGDLLRAVSLESCAAVAHRWGVSRTTVRRWRAILGVDRFNPGTRAVWCRLAPEKLTHARSCRTFTKRNSDG